MSPSYFIYCKESYIICEIIISNKTNWFLVRHLIFFLESYTFNSIFLRFLGVNGKKYFLEKSKISKYQQTWQKSNKIRSKDTIHTKHLHAFCDTQICVRSLRICLKSFIAKRVKRYFTCLKKAYRRILQHNAFQIILNSLKVFFFLLRNF